MTDKMTSPQAIRAVLPAACFITAIFFCNFLSRVVFAPLMPVIQADLGFTHAGAGHLFLALAVGNGSGLLCNGFISLRLGHRRTVGTSAFLVGVVSMIIPSTGVYATLLGAVYLLGLSVGLYLPSGIATLTSLIRKEDWGKAMALHELAPNAAYVAAPLLAEAVLLFFDWRTALYVMGGVQLCLGLWFIKSGRGGEFPGVVPDLNKVKEIMKTPVLWVIVLFMSTAVGASIGPYSMLPLYLADSHGFTREEANHLLAISRVAACAGPLISGWITDKWGPKPAITLAVLTNGIALALLGLASGEFLVSMVIIQPVCSVLLFAPAFTLLSMAYGPKDRPVAIALMGPINAILGIGVFPTFLGYMGDAGMFDVGFLVLGCVLLLTLAVIPVLSQATGTEQ